MANLKMPLHCSISLIRYLTNLFSEVNPIPVKQAVNFMGYDAGNPRLPLTNMEIQNSGKLKLEMQKLNLVKW